MMPYLIHIKIPKREHNCDSSVLISGSGMRAREWVTDVTVVTHYSLILIRLHHYM